MKRMDYEFQLQQENLLCVKDKIKELKGVDK